MRTSLLHLLVLSISGGRVAAYSHNSHEHETEEHVPLHEQPFIQDSPEELEWKWALEVHHPIDKVKKY